MDWDGLGSLALILVAGCIVFGLIIMPITRLGTASVTVERNALQATLDAARQHGDKLELAAVTNSVAKFNKDLAGIQYYASMPVIGLWYSSNVMKTKPIQ